MAQVEMVTPEEFRAFLRGAGEPELIGQLCFMKGAQHVLRFLQRQGTDAVTVATVAEQVEDNLGVLHQFAAEQGIELPSIDL